MCTQYKVLFLIKKEQFFLLNSNYHEKIEVASTIKRCNNIS